MRRAALLALGGALLATTPAAAQSLFGTRGLGVPVLAQDARATALGGASVGLMGLNPSMSNPASLGGLRMRGVVAAIQPTARTVRFQGQEDDVGGTRFPLARILFPYGDRWVISLGYGGFLDQTWAVSSDGTIVLSGDTVETTDVFQSDGGISEVRLSAAYTLSPTLALGAAGGLYTGSATVTLTRAFGESGIPGLSNFQTRRQWNYLAPLAAAGLRWDPAEFLRVGASATWAGTLDAEVSEAARDDDVDVADRSIDMPLQASLGASAVLAPRLTAALAVSWAGWGAAADDFTAGDPLVQGSGIIDAARDTWNVGGGIEWAGARSGDRLFPIRIGTRWAQLPFVMQSGGEPATEWSAALGIGARLAGNEEIPLATADAAFEYGSREAGGGVDLTEDFWRFTLSIALFGR